MVWRTRPPVLPGRSRPPLGGWPPAVFGGDFRGLRYASATRIGEEGDPSRLLARFRGSRYTAAWEPQSERGCAEDRFLLRLR